MKQFSFSLMNSTEKSPAKRSILEHELVPQHRIISEEEKAKLLEKYKISLKNLPKISIKDPVVKLLKDAKVGDVVEIERKSTTAGKTKYYRVIINA